MASVLIVDDEVSFSSGLTEYLELQGHSVYAGNSLASARELLTGKHPDIVLLDLMLPDGSGLELLDELREDRPSKVVIMTGHKGVKSLIGRMDGDGISYLTKPIELRQLVAMVNSVSAGEKTRDAKTGPGDFGLMIGRSDAMQKIYRIIEQVAAADSTVLIRGESGTGKELVADAIHRLSDQDGPFVPVNCGSLAKDLLSSQLFGHEKGSFTGATRRHVGFFERAQYGTLFLDEITEMPLDMQSHLLRALETGKILRVGGEEEITSNARVVAATNRDPNRAIRDGKLREDLYFRLQVFPIQLPPLRERADDIPRLAEHFLGRLNDKHGASKRFDDCAEDRLRQHLWPGNVRELKHAIHRAYILSDGDRVEIPEHIGDDVVPDVEGVRVGRSIAAVERDLILATLEHYGNNRKAAAASLGISQKTLYNRLKQYESEQKSA